MSPVYSGSKRDSPTHGEGGVVTMPSGASNHRDRNMEDTTSATFLVGAIFLRNRRCFGLLTCWIFIQMHAHEHTETLMRNAEL